MKRIITILIAFIISGLIYFLIPLLPRHFPLLQHIVINYYLFLLRRTIIFLPVAVLIYFITPLRKFLDYERYVVKPNTTLFLILIFAVSMLATIFISWKCYHNIPYGDSTPVYYQAKILLTGHRWASVPVYPEFFNNRMVSNQGKYFGMSPLGHSIVLVIGFLLGIPWIIGPLLGALSLIIFYFIIRELFNQKSARVSAVFLLLSPTFLFMSASFLNQNSSLFFLLLGFLLLIKAGANDSGNRRTLVNGLSFLAGLCIGFAFFCRPTLPLVFVVSIILFTFT